MGRPCVKLESPPTLNEPGSTDTALLHEAVRLGEKVDRAPLVLLVMIEAEMKVCLTCRQPFDKRGAKYCSAECYHAAPRACERRDTQKAINRFEGSAKTLAAWNGEP
jgi:hypothetical protein